MIGTTAMHNQIAFRLVCAHTPLIAHLQGWQLQPACHGMQDFDLRAAQQVSTLNLGKSGAMTPVIVALTVSAS